MDDLRLRIEREDEITLPSGLIDGDLSLEEIGVVFLLAVIASGQAGFDHPRLQESVALDTVKRLKERGIFNVSVESGAVKISVCLDKAMPPQEPEENTP
jgi:hypothetical protein